MKLLITGSRTASKYWSFEDFEKHFIHSVIKVLRPTLIIHGDAEGIDRWAGIVALTQGIPVEVHPADWDRHGRDAGSVRNADMLWKGRPHQVLAFWDGHSPGTLDMIRKATQAGVFVTIKSLRQFYAGD